jgi:Fur family zinc uptake transcriptional regulator
MSHAAHDRTVPHSQHDHSPCIDEALEQARSLCEQRGVKLTQLREKVLSLVWSSHQPRGAYAMMDDMARDGRRVAPLTVYRALEFLEEHGLVHRVESLNAYVGCPEPGRPHSGQFLVCTRCGNAAELDDPQISASIAAGAERIGFTVQRQTVEVSGVCPACLAKA